MTYDEWGNVDSYGSFADGYGAFPEYFDFQTQETPADEGAIASLRRKWDEFNALWPTFQAQQQYAYGDPELREEWDFINTYAGSVITSVAWIFEQVGAAGDWFSSVFGLNGVAALFQPKKYGVKGLGIGPLIGAATIAGASAALIFIIDRIYAFLNNGRLLDIKRALVEQGKAPASILDTPEPQGIFGEVSGLIKWALIGAAAIYVLPQLMNRRG